MSNFIGIKIIQGVEEVRIFLNTDEIILITKWVGPHKPNDICIDPRTVIKTKSLGDLYTTSKDEEVFLRANGNNHRWIDE